MKRPSFQFYPGDWQSNSNLRRCTHAEKGVWLDALCLMHDQPEYGVLRWPLKEIAQASGARLQDLKSLVTKGVLKGSDAELTEPFVYTPRSGRKDGEPVTLVPTQPGPIWYSSRMVKDEYVRTIRGESTRFGDGNDEASKPAPKAAPKPPFGDGSSSSSSSSPSGNSVPDGTDAAGVKPGDPPPADPPPADPPKPPMEPDEIIFGYGVPLLVNAGSADKAARSFLGGLRKQHGDAAVIDKLRDCIREKPLQPLEWLAAALPPTKSSRHAGFENIDYRKGVTEDGRF